MNKLIRELQRKHSIAYLVLEKYDLEKEYFEALKTGEVNYEEGESK